MGRRRTRRRLLKRAASAPAMFLPDEVWETVAAHATAQTVARLECVSRRMRRCCRAATVRRVHVTPENAGALAWAARRRVASLSCRRLGVDWQPIPPDVESASFRFCHVASDVLNRLPTGLRALELHRLTRPTLGDFSVADFVARFPRLEDLRLTLVAPTGHGGAVVVRDVSLRRLHLRGSDRVFVGGTVHVRDLLLEVAWEALAADAPTADAPAADARVPVPVVTWSGVERLAVTCRTLDPRLLHGLRCDVLRLRCPRASLTLRELAPRDVDCEVDFLLVDAAAAPRLEKLRAVARRWAVCDLPTTQVRLGTRFTEFS